MIRVRFGESQKISLLCSNISNSRKAGNEQKISQSFGEFFPDPLFVISNLT